MSKTCGTKYKKPFLCVFLPPFPRSDELGSVLFLWRMNTVAATVINVICICSLRVREKQFVTSTLLASMHMHITLLPLHNIHQSLWDYWLSTWRETTNMWTMRVAVANVNVNISMLKYKSFSVPCLYSCTISLQLVLRKFIKRLFQLLSKKGNNSVNRAVLREQGDMEYSQSIILLYMRWQKEPTQDMPGEVCTYYYHYNNDYYTYDNNSFLMLYISSTLHRYNHHSTPSKIKTNSFSNFFIQSTRKMMNYVTLNVQNKK